MRTLLIGLAATGALLSLAAPAAASGPEPSSSEPAVSQSDGEPQPEVGPVDVFQVNGLFDAIVVDSIGKAIDRAGSNRSQALILQVDSRGAVVSDAAMGRLLDRIAEAPIPVAVWVGPTGARLYGASAQVLAVADVTGMAPGARVGNVGDPVSADVDLGPALTELADRTVGLSDARELGVFKQRISDEGIATIRNMLEALDGYEENGVVLDTTIEQVTDSGTVQRQAIASPRFSKLGLFEQLMHTVASPPVAYLLLLIGLALLIFEFFTAGVGVAGIVGAACTILACYGLAALPARWWAVTLIALAMLAFAVDVQVGIPRFWTGVGIVFTIVGSLWLFEPVGETSLRPNWLSLIAGIGGTMLAFIVGMPSMTRTRFATPTVGREWLIGAEGVAVVAVDPDGIVQVGDGQWRARTNRATPIQQGEPMRVAAIDGVTLEVEPLEGAARDYRERRSKHGDADADADAEVDPVVEPADHQSHP